MSQGFHWPRLGFWQWIFWLLLLGGIAAAVALRLAGPNDGPGGPGELKGRPPWGLSLGLNAFCGVGLAAGGFTVAAASYLLDRVHLPAYRLILPVSFFAGAAGYFVAIVTVLALPVPLAHTSPEVLLWSRRCLLSSVTCGAVACLAAAATLEFAGPRLHGRGPRFRAGLRTASAALLLLAAALVSWQQHSLIRPLLTMPERFSPLWATPLLPAIFLLSGVVACLAVVLFAASHSMRHSRARRPVPLLSGLATTLCLLLAAYLCLRLLDLIERGVSPLFWGAGLEVSLLGVEFSLFLLPVLFLSWRHNLASPRMLYACSAMVMVGFIANRLNTTITAAEAVSGRSHFPSSAEVVFAFSLVSLGIAGFRLTTKWLPECVAGKQTLREPWEVLLPHRNNREVPQEPWEAFLPRPYRRARSGYEDQTDR